jgi:diaminopimelate epimerase
MKILFHKYQGTGNDFIIFDNRNKMFPKKNKQTIKSLCDRKFGVGADGLILLEDSLQHDFKMIYYNADGNPGSMCGNGGRCIVAFAQYLDIIGNTTTFEAMNKIYHATLDKDLVSLTMNDVNQIESFHDHVFLNTGSPHHIEFEESINDIDIYKKGKEIRYGSPYFEEGTNVNFVSQLNKNTFEIRTYERGVEDETMSCGTGVTAVAIASHALHKTTDNSINLQTLGGNLQVSFIVENSCYKNIVLKGPATFVFKGSIQL